MLQVLERLLNGVRALIRVCAALLFVYMLFAILTQVLGRYLADYIDFTIDWTEETARFAQIWMILLGAGIAMQNKMHVGVDILMRHLPLTARKILLCVTSACCLGFLYIAASNSFRLIAVGRIQTSSAAGIPMDLVYWAMPVGLAYFGLEFILAQLSTLREMRVETPEEVEQ